MVKFVARLKHSEGWLTDWMVLNASSWPAARRAASNHLSGMKDYKSLVVAKSHDFGTMEYSYKDYPNGKWSEVAIGHVDYIMKKLAPQTEPEQP